jgi:hypothetical protein
MTDTQLLVGSLSNDLFRVASLTQRGSLVAAARFLEEAKRWSVPIQKHKVKQYILNIAQIISSKQKEDLSLELAEQCLMYGVLLQNYAVQIAKQK